MINIFDVDYTVLKGSTASNFLYEALVQKVIGLHQVKQLPFEWLRYKLGYPNKDFIEEAVRHLAGISKTTLDELGQVCFERRMKKNIYAQAAQLIAEIQKRGEDVVFASSSFQTLIQPLAGFLGVTRTIASVMEISEGKTTGRIVGESCFGAGKKAAVEAWLEKQGISPQDTCFYTDSYTDLPLMEYCGKAVAVNPDRFLKKEAKKRGWEILRFKKTLGLFDDPPAMP
jgi:HAD superfamily hydrolase (TIGR01490 family)